MGSRAGNILVNEDLLRKSGVSAGTLSNFASTRLIRVVISNRDHIILLNKSSNLKDVEYQVWNGRAYINLSLTPQMKRLKLQAFVRGLEMFKDSMLLPVSSTDFLDKANELFDTSSALSMELSPSVYARLMMMSSKDGSHIPVGEEVIGKCCRTSWTPTSFEMCRFDFPVLQSNGKVYTAEELNRRARVRQSIEDLVISCGKDYIRRREFTEDERSELVERSMQGDELTAEEMSNYLYDRHEMFTKACMKLVNKDVGSSDKPIKQTLASEGLFVDPTLDERTPDYIDIRAGEVTIFEFAVTDLEDPSPVFKRKEDKYSVYVDSLRRRYTTMRSALMTVIMNRNNEVFFKIYSDSGTTTLARMWIDLKATTDMQIYLKELIDYKTLIEGSSNYRQMREMSDDPVSSAGPEKVKRIMVAQGVLINMLLSSKLPSQAFSMRASRDVTMVGKASASSRSMMTEAPPEVRAMLDEDLRSEAKFNNMSPSDYSHGFKMMIEEMITAKWDSLSYSHEFKEMMGETTESVIAEGNRLLDEQSNIHKTKDSGAMGVSVYPKLFKFPLPSGTTTGPNVPFSMRQIGWLSDGTVAVRDHRPLFQPGDGSSREGFGISFKEISCIDEIEHHLFGFMTVADWSKDSLIEKFKETEAFRVMSFLEELSREVALLQRRRNAFGRSNSRTVFKRYKNFSLEIERSGMLKGDHQLVMRVFFKKTSDSEAPAWDMLNYFSMQVHEMEGATFQENTKVFASRWFTLALTDIEHYITIKSKALVILDDMSSKMLESGRATLSNMRVNQLDEVFSYPMMVMLEHKRATSTCCQLHRYLVHSATGLLSNKTKLVQEIFCNPVRTLLQAKIQVDQFNWFSRVLSSPMIIRHLETLSASTSGDYDNASLPSLARLDMNVPFSVIISEMYYGNIFNPAHGMKSHREKMVTKKTLEMESKYYTNLRNGEIKRKMEDIKSLMYDKETFHTYSPTFIKKMTEYWMNKENSAYYVSSAEVYSMTLVVDKVLKMSRSLFSANTNFQEFLEWSKGVKKMTVFEALVKTIGQASTASLLDYCRTDTEVMSFFSVFSKDQIGGVREILMQSIKTRLHTALFNGFFEKLCEDHPKEMVTKEYKKKEIQSSTVQNYTDRANLLNSNPNTCSIFFTINSDASKWSPSLMMMTFCQMVDVLPISVKTKEYFFTVLSSYASKIIFLPETIKRKIMTASDQRVDDDSILKMVKDFITDENSMSFTVHSGMGQGNFQHASSFFHCIVDDYQEAIITEVMEKRGIKIEMTAMISSDDSTTLVLLTTDRKTAGVIDLENLMMKTTAFPTPSEMSRMNRRDAEEAAEKVKEEFREVIKREIMKKLSEATAFFSEMFTVIRKAANIHINWKKTAVQRYIVEFNSVFSVRKRMFSASIKDCYTSVSVVDMTYPEMAVKEALSNCRRLMENGCYRSTIEMAINENRSKLLLWYNFTEDKRKEVCNELNCSEGDIPFHLGVIPNIDCFYLLTYGPELSMFKANLPTLEVFYKKIYRWEDTRTLDSMQREDMSYNQMSNIRLVMASRPDKQLAQMKRDHFHTKEERDRSYERVSDHFLERSKVTDNMERYRMGLDKYLMGIHRAYGFSSSYRMHSVIRALQFDHKISIDGIGDTSSYSPVLAVRAVMKAADSKNYFEMFSDLETIYLEMKNNQYKLSTLSRNYKARHPKFRKFTMSRDKPLESTSAEDVMEFVMGVNPKPKASTIRMFEEIARCFGVSSTMIIQDPLSWMVRTFPKNPQRSFHRLVTTMCNKAASTRLNVISDEPTKFSRKEDMLMFMRTKQNPLYTLEEENHSDSNNINTMFTTAVSLNSDELFRKLVDQVNMMKDDTLRGPSKVIYNCIKRARIQSLAQFMSGCEIPSLDCFVDKVYFSRMELFRESILEKLRNTPNHIVREMVSRDRIGRRKYVTMTHRSAAYLSLMVVVGNHLYVEISGVVSQMEDNVFCSAVLADIKRLMEEGTVNKVSFTDKETDRVVVMASNLFSWSQMINRMNIFPLETDRVKCRRGKSKWFIDLISSYENTDIKHNMAFMDLSMDVNLMLKEAPRCKMAKMLSQETSLVELMDYMETELGMDGRIFQSEMLTFKGKKGTEYDYEGNIRFDFDEKEAMTEEEVGDNFGLNLLEAMLTHESAFAQTLATVQEDVGSVLSEEETDEQAEKKENWKREVESMRMERRIKDMMLSGYSLDEIVFSKLCDEEERFFMMYEMTSFSERRKLIDEKNEMEKELETLTKYRENMIDQASKKKIKVEEAQEIIDHTLEMISMLEQELNNKFNSGKSIELLTDEAVREKLGKEPNVDSVVEALKENNPDLFSLINVVSSTRVSNNHCIEFSFMDQEEVLSLIRKAEAFLSEGNNPKDFCTTKEREEVKARVAEVKSESERVRESEPLFKGLLEAVANAEISSSYMFLDMKRGNDTNNKMENLVKLQEVFIGALRNKLREVTTMNSAAADHSGSTSYEERVSIMASAARNFISNELGYQARGDMVTVITMNQMINRSMPWIRNDMIIQAKMYRLDQIHQRIAITMKDKSLRPSPLE